MTQNRLQGEITPVQGPALKNERNVQYKRYYLNFITQILAKRINNYTTIKDSCATRIIDPAFLKLCTEGNSEPLYVCDKYVIKFGTGKTLFYYTIHIMWTLGKDNQQKLQQ